MQTSRARRIRFASLAIVGATTLAALTGCSSGGGSEASSGATSSTVTAAAQPAAGQEAAAAALEDGRTVIDVRTQEEYDAGHIDGATLIDLQSSTFSDEIAKLDPEGAYVVYCHSGNRSAQAAAQMQAAGLDVVDGGGIGDMQAAGWTAGG